MDWHEITFFETSQSQFLKICCHRGCKTPCWNNSSTWVQPNELPGNARNMNKNACQPWHTSQEYLLSSSCGSTSEIYLPGNIHLQQWKGFRPVCSRTKHLFKKKTVGGRRSDDEMKKSAILSHPPPTQSTPCSPHRVCSRKQGRQISPQNLLSGWGPSADSPVLYDTTVWSSRAPVLQCKREKSVILHNTANGQKTLQN